ncbi:MAG TPA: DNA polymerase III subunit epsilon [Roseiarcus sp.]|nr:DNA polymerase III subunit epsilon [Roseiarcus sp.]
MREIVLDTETTGLSPVDGHRVVEIGCVEIVHQIPTGVVYHTLINPERDVPEDAFRVHGHSTEALSPQPIFAKIAPDFLSFIGADPLVIHNAEFDIGFLNAELIRLGAAPIAPSRVVDTLAIARRKHPGAPNSLDALCDRYRIDRSRRLRHGALLDAEILVEVYGELLGGRQRSLAFVVPGAEGRAAAQSSAQPVARATAAVISLITEAERAAHALHVAALGDEALWRHYLAEPAE